MKSMLKSQLAEAAGVSTRTFCRWLKLHQAELEKRGVKPKAKLIPPLAVVYICEQYGIDL